MLLVAQFLTQALSYRHIAYSLVSSCFVFRAWGVARRYVYITVLFGSLASCSQHRAFADKFCLIWPLGLAFASSYDIASLTWQVWLTCLACCSCYQGFGYAFVFVITLNLLACCSCHRGFADASVFVTTLNLFSMLLLLLELCRCVYYLLWCWIYLARCFFHWAFAAAFILCHNVEFIKHAALALGNLRMRLLSVTTLNSFSMLLLPSELCRCVYFCHDVEFISYATLCHRGLADTFVICHDIEFIQHDIFCFGLELAWTLLMSWNFTIKVFAFTVLNCRC